MDDQIVNGHVSQVKLIRIADANEDIEELRDIDIGKEALEIGHLTGIAGLEKIILGNEIADLPFIPFQAHAFRLIGPDGKAVSFQSFLGFLHVALQRRQADVEAVGKLLLGERRVLQGREKEGPDDGVDTIFRRIHPPL